MDNSSTGNSKLYSKEGELEQIVDNIPAVLFQFRRLDEGEYQMDYLSKGIGELLHSTEDSTKIDRYVIMNGWDFIYEQIVEEDRDALIKSIEESAANFSQWEHTFRIRNLEGEIVQLHGRAKISKLDNGHIIWRGIVMDAKDRIDRDTSVNEQKLKEDVEEKEFLLKEINHRVKNNMQIISSLLHLQADAVEDKSAARYLLESRNRIQSMAIAHEILYNTSDLKSIEIHEYLSQLVQQLSYVFDQSEEVHEIKVNVDEVHFTLKKVVIIGLLVNELVTNSLKHAFDEGEAGTIEINGNNLDNNKMKLQVKDDGKGLPDDMVLNESDSLGMQIIQSLAGQLSKDYVYKTDEKNGGTLFEAVIERSL